MVVESCPHGEFPNGTKKRSTDLEFADADVLAKYDEEARPVKKQKAVPEKTEPTGATLATAPATIGVFGTAANMDAICPAFDIVAMETKAQYLATLEDPLNIGRYRECAFKNTKNPVKPEDVQMKIIFQEVPEVLIELPNRPRTKTAKESTTSTTTTEETLEEPIITVLDLAALVGASTTTVRSDPLPARHYAAAHAKRLCFGETVLDALCRYNVKHFIDEVPGLIERFGDKMKCIDTKGASYARSLPATSEEYAEGRLYFMRLAKSVHGVWWREKARRMKLRMEGMDPGLIRRVKVTRKMADENGGVEGCVKLAAEKGGKDEKAREKKRYEDKENKEEEEEDEDEDEEETYGDDDDDDDYVPRG